MPAVGWLRGMLLNLQQGQLSADHRTVNRGHHADDLQPEECDGSCREGLPRGQVRFHERWTAGHRLNPVWRSVWHRQ